MQRASHGSQGSQQQITGWEPTAGVAVGFMMGVSPVSPMKFWWLSHVESHSVNRC